MHILCGGPHSLAEEALCGRRLCQSAAPVAAAMQDSAAKGFAAARKAALRKALAKGFTKGLSDPEIEIQIEMRKYTYISQISRDPHSKHQ